MIRIIVVGKLTQAYLKEGIQHYQKQIPVKLEWIEVADEADALSKDIEGERILSKIKEQDQVVLLAIEGVSVDSMKFSEMINRMTTYGPGDIVFVIGGSYGVSDSVKQRANYKVSFSEMTFPHQLMRLILIEQIYRAFMIMKNHPYHK